MTLLSITTFAGRFHPVLVHLPIGILVLGCFFQLLTASRKFSFLKPSIPLVYLSGAIGAIFSCITGYLLSQGGDYNGATVATHQWLGIGLAILTGIAYLISIKEVKPVVLHMMAGMLLILVTLTGHYGGTLTHGADYLSAGFDEAKESKTAIPPVVSVQDALAYAHMIQPLLKNRCYSCHGADKQKGKLRLDTREFMLKGGEDGKAVVPGSAEESELIKRLLLSSSDEDHMPPKEKPQLTAEEIELLSWWIRQGADFDKKVKELKQPGKMKQTLLSFQSGTSKKPELPNEIPAAEVGKADAGIIADLKKEGIVVIPVTSTSNYLAANFVTAKVKPENLKLLGRLKDQLIWLNLANTALDDEGIKTISGLSSLIRLHLNHTSITDQAIPHLKKLNNLQYINLVGTKITAAGVEQLKGLKALKNIYLYQSAVDKKDQERLKKMFHKVNIDFGGYIVPQ